MKIQIITVGKPYLSFAKEGIDEYTKRLSRFVDLHVHHVKENAQTDQKILKLVEKDFCVLLDEIGKEYTTKQFSQFLEKQKNQSKNISFVIGGPDGHTESLRERADSLWALSPLTFPHDIATMLTLEAIYRGFSILENHPYHRI
jgi:23S rRNA (pseudouridine1915-N3)-methyltransferase